MLFWEEGNLISERQNDTSLLCFFKKSNHIFCAKKLHWKIGNFDKLQIVVPQLRISNDYVPIVFLLLNYGVFFPVEISFDEQNYAYNYILYRIHILVLLTICKSYLEITSTLFHLALLLGQMKNRINCQRKRKWLECLTKSIFYFILCFFKFLPNDSWKRNPRIYISFQFLPRVRP